MTIELREYYFPSNKNLTDDQLFGEDPHAQMLEAKKKGHH